MPRRTDMFSILLGAGSIVIGQGCAFGRSGPQAVKAMNAKDFLVETLVREL